MNNNEIKVKSLKKALDVLNCFAVKPTWGVTEISELWLLEDGRVAEVTSVGFVKDEQYYFHRKFRNIVKHRNDIWFKLSDLEDALFLIALKSVQYEVINCRKQKG